MALNPEEGGTDLPNLFARLRELMPKERLILFECLIFGERDLESVLKEPFTPYFIPYSYRTDDQIILNRLFRYKDSNPSAWKSTLERNFMEFRAIMLVLKQK